MYLTGGQLELSGGMRRDRGECLVDAELYMPPPAIQKKGTLYIIAEIEGAPLDQPGRERSEDAALCRETQMMLLQEYYKASTTATITSALRHALEVANQHVFNRNSATLPPARRGVGISCAVVRGSEVYLAQMPPTQAFLTHQGQLKALPTSPERQRGPRPLENASASAEANQATLPLPITGGKPATTARRSETIPALGRYASIEPDFSRHVFEEGDLLVLCSLNIGGALSNEQADQFFLKQDSRAALYNLSEFTRTAKITDGYVLAISAKSDYGVVPPNMTDAPKADEGRLRSSVEGVAASVSLLTSKFTALNRPRSVTPRPEGYIYEDNGIRPRHSQPETAHEASPIAPASPEVFGFEASSKSSASPFEPLQADDRNNDPWLRREEDSLQEPPYLRGRKLADEPVPVSRNFSYSDGAEVTDQSEPAPTPEATKTGARIYSPPSTAEAAPNKGWSDRLKQSRPKTKAKQAVRLEANPVSSPYIDMVGADGYNSTAVRSKRGFNGVSGMVAGRRWPLIVALAVLLGVAVVFLIFAVSGGAVGGNSSKALDIVKAAEQKRGQAQAMAATNPAGARKLIEQAKADLAAATKEKADLNDINSVQNGLKITLDNINRVVVPPDLRLAVDLTSQGAGVKISQGVLSAAGDTLYLLDTGRGVIYAADLVGGIKPILKTGDPAGGSVFGKPVAMAARLDSIVVLDEQNISYVYNRGKGDWTAAKLGGTAGWAKPVRQLATYQGNLYLLGPAGSQILKYNAGGYAGNPEEWLNPALADSLKLDQSAAFSIDGTIYTLGKDGRLVQLSRPNGKPKGEKQAEYDLNMGERVGPAVINPTVLQVGGLEYPFAFVVDKEKRVLQFQKEGGGFVQQFQATLNGKEFDNLRDVAIDEPNKKLYLIGEQKVYVFRLPADTAGPVFNATVAGPTAASNANSNAVVNTGPKPTPTFRP